MGSHSPSPSPRELYEVLGIPSGSSVEEIRRAYKALCRRWHPDKHPPSSRPEAEARFKAIRRAYENALQGPPAMQQRSPTTAFTFSGSVRRKPPPVERKLECTLEELCRGCKKEIKFTRDVLAGDGLIVQQEETQTIRVRPGWKKGTKITFEGMGDERHGCLPADVVFLISEKEHPVFKRVGNDLVLKVEVPMVSALTGWTFSVRLLTGEKMSCSFQDEIIYPGFEKIIQGQGMPLPNEKGKKGDLRIKFHIIFPKRLSTEQRMGIAEILKDDST